MNIPVPYLTLVKAVRLALVTRPQNGHGLSDEERDALEEFAGAVVEMIRYCGNKKCRKEFMPRQSNQIYHDRRCREAVKKRRRTRAA